MNNTTLTREKEMGWGGGWGGGQMEKKGVLKTHLSVRTNHHLGPSSHLHPEYSSSEYFFSWMVQKQEGVGQLSPLNIFVNHLLVGFQTTALYFLLNHELFFWLSNMFTVLKKKCFWYCLTHFHHYKLYLSKSVTTLSTDSRTIYGFDQRWEGDWLCLGRRPFGHYRKFGCRLHC